jgi:hypothetical protein
MTDFSNLTKEELESALLVEEAACEDMKYQPPGKSKEFWKAVENINKIKDELRKRK